MTGEPDHVLMDRLRKGDGRAFRNLVATHHGMVYAVVRSVLGERPEVEDVVQKTFLRVHSGLNYFRGDSRLSTWIYRIARNEALREAGRAKPETVPIEEVESVVAGGEDAGAEVEQAERVMRLETAMRSLQEEYRTALELRYLAERSYEEIAEAMDLPLGTVKTYIHRGKNELAKILRREELAASRWLR